jgi:hypothetical protein
MVEQTGDAVTDSAEKRADSEQIVTKRYTDSVVLINGK